MKQKVSALFILLAFTVVLLQAQPVKEHGSLSVEGTRLVDQHGNTIMLQGVSYGWHNWWPRFYNKETVNGYATTGHALWSELPWV